MLSSMTPDEIEKPLADAQAALAAAAAEMTDPALSSAVKADADKVRENRLRRMAQRQGYRLVKNPRRDTRAADYGSYMLVDAATSGLVADFGWDHVGFPEGSSHLDDVERYLTGGER